MRIESRGPSIISYFFTETRKSSGDRAFVLLCRVVNYGCIFFPQLLSIGNSYAPDIEYQYTVMRDKRDVYVWALTDEWGQCDKMCSGMWIRRRSRAIYNLLFALPTKYVVFWYNIIIDFP